MIPWFLIMVGGVMVYSGVKSTNPLAVLKGVLDGSGIPTGTDGSQASTGVASSNVTTDPNKALGDPTQNSPTGNYSATTQRSRNAGETVGGVRVPTSKDNSTALTNNGGRVPV